MIILAVKPKAPQRKDDLPLEGRLRAIRPMRHRFDAIHNQSNRNLISMQLAGHSRHIFIFPFQWDYLASSARKGDTPYRDRTSLKAFNSVFSKVSPLKRTYFEIGTSAEHYSEYLTKFLV